MANLPEGELRSKERLGFQIEQAFWFYEDFYRQASPQALPKLTLKAFAEQMINHCPFEIPGLPKEEAGVLIDVFYHYKRQVPTCGAIILNRRLDKCLMVRGWSSKSTWGFPKGKISKEESPADCAMREVREETGFNVGGRLTEADFIQVESAGQTIRLYIIAGVEEDTFFAPLTRREIKEIKWHSIAALTNASNSNRYYNVTPFVGPLRKWIKKHRKEYVKESEEESTDDVAGLHIEGHSIERVERAFARLSSFKLDLNALLHAYDCGSSFTVCDMSTR